MPRPLNDGCGLALARARRRAYCRAHSATGPAPPAISLMPLSGAIPDGDLARGTEWPSADAVARSRGQARANTGRCTPRRARLTRAHDDRPDQAHAIRLRGDPLRRRRSRGHDDASPVSAVDEEDAPRLTGAWDDRDDPFPPLAWSMVVSATQR